MSSSIGALNKRITLQSMTQTSDGMGGYSETSKSEITVWAAIWPVSASEQVKAMQNTMTISHRIRIRYRTVDPSWRIRFGLRYFSIVSVVNPNEGNAWIDILSKEATS